MPRRGAQMGQSAARRRKETRGAAPLRVILQNEARFHVYKPLDGAVTKQWRALSGAQAAVCVTASHNTASRCRHFAIFGGNNTKANPFRMPHKPLLALPPPLTPLPHPPPPPPSTSSFVSLKGYSPIYYTHSLLTQTPTCFNPQVSQFGRPVGISK